MNERSRWNNDMSARTSSQARRVFRGSVVVLVGDQRISLAGREAAMVAELAIHAAEIRAVPVGSVTFDVTQTRATLKIQAVHQPIHLTEAPGP